MRIVFVWQIETEKEDVMVFNWGVESKDVNAVVILWGFESANKTWMLFMSRL